MRQLKSKWLGSITEPENDDNNSENNFESMPPCVTSTISDSLALLEHDPVDDLVESRVVPRGGYFGFQSSERANKVLF